MAGKFFVVQGAVCSCQFGASPDKLKVLTNTTEYINDDGQQKLIASTRDIGQPFEAKTFGACKVTRSACKPAVTSWVDFYEKVTLTNSGKILTESSKAICAVGGSPCVKIDFHGQTAGVSQAQTDAAAPAMAVLNPLAPKPVAEGKEVPKVKKISLALTGRAKPETLPSKEKGGVAAAKVRVDEPLKFEVTEYWNKAKADPAKVSWKVVKAHAFDGEHTLHSEVGLALELTPNTPGLYRVFAFGNPDSASDESCAIDLEVAYNGIKSVDAPEGTSRAVTVRGGTEHRIRRGVPTELQAVFDFEPSDAERAATTLQVTDAGGSEVASGTDRVAFTPANTAAAYTATASFTAADGSVQRATKTFKTEANGVVAVTSPEGEKVRPGTTMTFRVSQMVYNSLDNLTPGEVKNIKWQLNGREVGTGTSITLNGAQYFSRPGAYVVEAYAATANAWDAKTGKPGGSNEKDDWRFEVVANAITAVEGPAQWIVGKRYNLTAKTSMPYDPRLDGAINWTSPGGTGNANGTSATGVYMNAKGTGAVTAKLSGSSKSLAVTAEALKLKRWCFVDSQGEYKSKAGWGETLKAVIEAPGASGEKLHLHLLEFDNPGDSNYLKDLGEVTFNDAGIAEVSFKTDDIKEALTKLYFEGKFYDVYFAAEKGGMSFEGAKEFKAEGKALLFPGAESNKSGSEVGKYVFIDGKPNVVEVRYLDGKGHRIYRVLPYGEKVRMHVQTMNLAGQKVTVSAYLNLPQGDDKAVIQDKEFTVAADETIKIDIDTGAWKGAIAVADRKKVAMFYMVLKEADGDRFVYPEDLSVAQALDLNKVNFYHHLKLSEAPDAVNQRAAANAPAVIGEPLSEDEEETSNCPRCRKITIEEIEGTFGALPQHRAFRQEMIDYMNKFVEEGRKSGKIVHVDTCLRKAHFFAQVGAETLGIHPDWMVETDVYKFSVKSAKASFGQRARNLESAGLLADYCAERPQKKLLNYLYAKENGFGNGNGDEASGDGYKFRGRGLKQITGRGNYKEATAMIKTYFPEHAADLEENPDLVKEAKYAVLSALAYWETHKIWQTADQLKVSSDENIKKIRARVNPGLKGWQDAKRYFDKGLVAFKVDACTPVQKKNVIPTGGTWVDPFANPQRTYYNSNRVHKEQNGAFGPVRRYGDGRKKIHQGLDIFADVGTVCKACLPGKIVQYMNEGNAGYGNVMVLEVKGDDLRKAKREYTLEFADEVENGEGWDEDADFYYLRYAHLSGKLVEPGPDEVPAGKEICISGDTGNAKGVPNPHLHFEIAMKKSGNGRGTSNRYNPAFFVRLTPIDEPTQTKVLKDRTKKK